jgi:phage shock protein PspC (stress-responsive transcriptional regulator)
MNETPAPKQLLRSPDNRVFAGIAGGLARYFGVDPVIFRIGFGVLAFVGGLGIVAYLAAWLFVPEDDGSGQPKPIQWTAGRVAGAAGMGVIALIVIGSGPFWFLGDGFEGWLFGPLALVALAVFLVAAFRLRRTGEGQPFSARRVFVLLAVGLGAAAVLSVVAVGAAWAAAEGFGGAIAVTVIAFGVVMALAAFHPRVRARGAGGAAWLALPALALAIPAGAVAAADFELHGGYGERYWHPASVAEIPDDGYEHAVGEAVVDLRGLDWRRGETLDLEVDQGIGELRVITPRNVCVELDAHVDGGAIWFRGDADGGVDHGRDHTPAPSSAPRLRLDADLAFGELVVADHDVAAEDHHWHDLDDSESRAAFQRAEAACEVR